MVTVQLRQANLRLREVSKTIDIKLLPEIPLFPRIVTPPDQKVPAIMETLEVWLSLTMFLGSISGFCLIFLLIVGGLTGGSKKIDFWPICCLWTVFPLFITLPNYLACRYYQRRHAQIIAEWENYRQRCRTAFEEDVLRAKQTVLRVIRSKKIPNTTQWSVEFLNGKKAHKLTIAERDIEFRYGAGMAIRFRSAHYSRGGLELYGPVVLYDPSFPDPSVIPGHSVS